MFMAKDYFAYPVCVLAGVEKKRDLDIVQMQAGKRALTICHSAKGDRQHLSEEIK